MRTRVSTYLAAVSGSTLTLHLPLPAGITLATEIAPAEIVVYNDGVGETMNFARYTSGDGDRGKCWKKVGSDTLCYTTDEEPQVGLTVSYYPEGEQTVLGAINSFVAAHSVLTSASIAKVKESIRLIYDETNDEVFCSSGQKIMLVSLSSETGYNVALEFAIPTGLTTLASDYFTIEWDWGTSLEEVKAALNSLNVTLTQTELDYLASQISGLNLSSAQISALSSDIATALGTVTATLTSSQIDAIVAGIEDGVTLNTLNTTIGNAGTAAANAATKARTAATQATTAAQNANSASNSAATAAANAATAAAALESLATETQLTALPSTAVINLEQPAQSSGAVVLTIAPDIEYTLGDVTSLTLVLSAPPSDSRYHDYAVRFHATADFTLQITHYDTQNNIVVNYPYGASCKSGSYYLLSVYANVALLAEF
jgi:hypothetical protein